MTAVVHILGDPLGAVVPALEGSMVTAALVYLPQRIQWQL